MKKYVHTSIMICLARAVLVYCIIFLKEIIKILFSPAGDTDNGDTVHFTMT